MLIFALKKPSIWQYAGLVDSVWDLDAFTKEFLIWGFGGSEFGILYSIHAMDFFLTLFSLFTTGQSCRP